LSSIKKLASQTLWYGLSSIAARFIGYLLVPYLTYKFTESAYGEMSIVFSFIPFLNVIVTHGMETAYFKFGSKDNEEKIYHTSSFSMMMVTTLVLLVLIKFSAPIAQLLQITAHPEYITLMAWIVGLDALATIPFSKLRLESNPKKFAFIKVAGILLNVFTTYYFISMLPHYIQLHPTSIISSWYKTDWSVGYVLLAGIVQNVFVLFLLKKELNTLRFSFDFELWKQMIWYALPLIIVGFGGVINETFDRIMLGWWAPGGTPEANKVTVGIYSACYKLSILITISVQAFRMGAEPFFFKQALLENAPKTYARVMKFFVITLCIMFLMVVLYLDIWKEFIRNPAMYVGLGVVPILLIANIFLGIYYNLSIWYKLSNKTMAGAWITLLGAVITLTINFIAIPYFSYWASAWATFFCYGTMMYVSFKWGQKVYPIPYATKKLIAYFVITLLLYGLHLIVPYFTMNNNIRRAIATFELISFIIFVARIEKKEIKLLLQKPIPAATFN